MNRTANGGYGHHNFVCDADGPLLMKPEFTEAVWCCTFHGLLGLHTLKRYVVVGSDRGVFINFPFDVTAPVATSNGVWQVAMSCREEPGSFDLFDPAHLGRRLAARAAPVHAAAGLDGEDRRDRCARPARASSGGARLRARAGRVGRKRRTARALRLRAPRRGSAVEPRGAEVGNPPAPSRGDTSRRSPPPAGEFGSTPAGVGRSGQPGWAVAPAAGCEREPPGHHGSHVDANEADLAALAKQAPCLSLTPWERTRRDAPAAFVFDLIAVPQSGQFDRKPPNRSTDRMTQGLNGECFARGGELRIMRRVLCCLVLCLMVSSAAAQTATVDSMDDVSAWKSNHTDNRITISVDPKPEEEERHHPLRLAGRGPLRHLLPAFPTG